MLKGARSAAPRGSSERAEAWPGWSRLTPAKHRLAAGRHALQDHAWLRALLLMVPCLAAGAIGGLIVGASMTDGTAHRKGACVALHMAAAHGYVDERQQRVVMRALVTAINPDVESFSGGYRAMREACAAAGGRS
jgi:hypothetical protein